jgi:hypothetical protein
MDVQDGEAAGCTIYHVNLTANKPLDFLYFDVQFPRNISDYKVSAGERAVTPGRAIGSYTLFTYGKNSTGDCEVREQLPSSDPDLHVRLAGPAMIDVRTFKTEPLWGMFGDFALSTKSTSSNSARLYTEGSYEYTVLGLPVRKSLKFTGDAIRDQK